MPGEAIRTKQLIDALDSHISQWREFRRGHNIGTISASSIEVDINNRALPLVLSDSEVRAVAAGDIADLIIPDQPIRKLGFGAIVGLDNQHVRGYLGLGGLNFVSRDFEETLDRIKSYDHVPFTRTSRFGVDAIAVGSAHKPWHILAEQPVYSPDASSQRAIGAHYTYAESVSTEDVITSITSDLAHVRVNDGESLMGTEWVTAHDFAVANDIINRQASSGIENRGAMFYTTLVRHLITAESGRYQDAISYMKLLEHEYGIDFSLTSTTHLHDRFFDSTRSQIVISREALSEIAASGSTARIDGMGNKGLEVVQRISEESMHLRPRKF